MQVVRRLALHWAAWDVSGNQEEFGPDAWHSFEVGHKSRARNADHSEDRGTSPAYSNTCSAACLYAPFVFTTKEAMNAIVAPKVQTDSEWEGSSTTNSASKPRNSTERDMAKTFATIAENSNRLMQALLPDSSQKEADSAAKLRIFREILGDPNCSEGSKVRAQSLMESLLQSQMDELQR